MTDILTRVLYAGYIDLPEWSLTMVPAKHEPLIGLETYQAIQTRLNGAARVPVRKDTCDFPLRGFVTCGCCGKPMTSSWSKGRSRKYPYYMCFNKDCPDYRKSVLRDTMEREFEELLSELKPSEELFAMAVDIFRDVWNSRVDSEKTRAASLRQELSRIERKVEQLFDRIVDADSETLIKAYEKRIRELECERPD